MQYVCHILCQSNLKPLYCSTVCRYTTQRLFFDQTLNQGDRGGGGGGGEKSIKGTAHTFFSPDNLSIKDKVLGPFCVSN